MPMTVRYTTIKGQVIAENRGGVRKLYVPDPLGSTVALIDDTQTITDTFSYWPYGEVASRTGSTPTPFQFVGTLGYYSDNYLRNYVRARQLDKTTGRWTSQDPIGSVSGDHNFYAYTRSNPTSTADETGLATGGIGTGQCPGRQAVNWIRQTLAANPTCRQAFRQACPQGLSAILGGNIIVTRSSCDGNPNGACTSFTIPNGGPCGVDYICFSNTYCNTHSALQKAQLLMWEIGNACACDQLNSGMQNENNATNLKIACNLTTVQGGGVNMY